MDTARLVPTTLALAALVIGSACSASTADSSGTVTSPASTMGTAPPASLSGPPSVPAAPVVTTGVTNEPTNAPAAGQLSTTTAPTTTLPSTTSPPTTAPSVQSAPIDAVDVAGQSVFGVRLFDAVDVEAVAGDVSVRLGAPTRDSGWQPMAGQVDCTGSTEFRVLWWGDFRMTFERYQGDGDVRDELSAWTVGDPNLSGLVPIGGVPPASPSNVVTLEGIGLGSTRADLAAAWVNLHHGGPDRIVVLDRGGTLTITLDDGDQVIGFGNGPFDCPTDEIR